MAETKINYQKILRTADTSNLTDRELRMYIAIANRINIDGFCEASNEHFQNHFKVSERSVSEMISSLKEKGLITVIQNKHKHKRHIYLNGYKLVERPYTPITNENVMTPEQLQFHKLLPDRDIDCDWPQDMDMNLVCEEIQKSYFLKKARNMSLKSFVKLYDRIISGGYRDTGFMNEKDSFSCRRNYTKKQIASIIRTQEDLDELFPDDELSDNDKLSDEDIERRFFNSFFQDPKDIEI